MHVNTTEETEIIVMTGFSGLIFDIKLFFSRD